MNTIEYAIELHRLAKESGIPYSFDHCLRIALEEARHFREAEANRTAKATA
jgi:hypothetical protein